MKLDLFNNKYKSSNVAKIIFADIVCFLLVAIFSIGFCYAYFSAKQMADGTLGLAEVKIEYRKNVNDPSSCTNTVYGNINDGTNQDITSGLLVTPGDTLNIKGYAVNESGVGVYALARLEVVTNRDTEVVWYNISNNKPLYVERGLFQVGASVLDVNASQELSISYVFEGDRYTNQYVIESINLTLHAHQKDFLSTADDYYNYSAVNGYSQDSIYATHSMVGRKRSVWRDADANISGLNLESLDKDILGAYLINSCKDWMIFAEHANEITTSGKTFKLNAYLDFANCTTLRSAGTFSGTLDGQGYTLCNISIQTINNFSGLFLETVNATIRNLGLDGFSLSQVDNDGNASVGSVASLVRYISDSTTIENCYTIGASMYDSSVTYDISIGMPNSIVGGYIGGLVGSCELYQPGATITIKNCYTQLNIFTDIDKSLVGGIAGEIDEDVYIENCYYNGNIEAEYGYAGLMLGESDGYIGNSFGITDNFISKTGDGVMVNKIYGDNVNLADINNTGKTEGNTDYNKVEKVGSNQTELNITINTFHSAGLMRDAFGWDTSIWATDIYTGNNGLLLLRKFYNF